MSIRNKALTLVALVALALGSARADGIINGGGTASTGANPTATAGPTAVNGSAPTFMRSDAAPPVQAGSASQQGILQCGTGITCSGGTASVSTAVTSWTPTDASGAGLTFTAASAAYLKTGNSYTITAAITYPSTASTANAEITGFPTANGSYRNYCVAEGSNSGSIILVPFVAGANMYMNGYNTSGQGVTARNVDLSGQQFFVTCTYF